MMGPMGKNAGMEVEAIDWEKKADGPSEFARPGPSLKRSLAESCVLGMLDPGSTNLALVGTLSSMRDRGVKFLYGRWLIEGRS